MVTNTVLLQLEAKQIASIRLGAGEITLERKDGDKAAAPVSIGDIAAVQEPWRVGGWNRSKRLIRVNYQSDGVVHPRWFLIEDKAAFDRLYAECVEDAKAHNITIDPNKAYAWASGKGPCRWRPAGELMAEACRTHIEVAGVETLRKTKAANSAVTGWKITFKKHVDIGM